MRLVVSDTGSKGNSAIFSLLPRPHEGAGNSPKHDHGCNVDGSKFFKGGVSGHAYGHQPPIIDENLPKVEAEATQNPTSSRRKVGGWGRTWIIELISLFLIVVLSAGSAVSLLVQVEDGEREGGWWWRGDWGEGSVKYNPNAPHRCHHTFPPDQPRPRSISRRRG